MKLRQFQVNTLQMDVFPKPALTEAKASKSFRQITIGRTLLFRIFSFVEIALTQKQVRQWKS